MKVTNTPKEKSLDVAIIIPSYDEGSGIMLPLDAIARQELIDDITLSVIVVINNSQCADTSVKESNTETLQVLEKISNSQESVDQISNSTFKDFENISTKRAIKKALKNKLKLVIVDLFQDENAPKTCNVGVAHQSGLEIALPAMRTERSIICRTDADTQYNPYYIQSAIDLFKDKTIDGATGPLHFVYDKSLGGHKEYQEFKKIEEIQSLSINVAINLHNYLHLRGKKKNFEENTFGIPLEEAEIVRTPGSNMIFTTEVYQSSDGIEPLPGAEDVIFALKEIEKGRRIINCPGLNINVQERISERTEEGHGHGFSVKNIQQNNSDDIYVQNLGAIFLEHQVEDIVFNKELSSDQKKEILTKELSRLSFSKEEAEKIVVLHDQFPWVNNIWQNPHLQVFLRKKIKAVASDLPIDSFINQILKTLEGDIIRYSDETEKKSFQVLLDVIKEADSVKKLHTIDNFIFFKDLLSEVMTTLYTVEDYTHLLPVFGQIIAIIEALLSTPHKNGLIELEWHDKIMNNFNSNWDVLKDTVEKEETDPKNAKYILDMIMYTFQRAVSCYDVAEMTSQ